MEPSVIFSIANAFVLIGWILLIFASKWKHSLNIIVPIVILVLAATYAFLIIPALPTFSVDSFSTLENLKILFQNDQAVAAGWLHYLTFDLLVGAFIVREGMSLGMPRWQYTVPLPFTFMLGPIGLLIFAGFRLARKTA